MWYECRPAIDGSVGGKPGQLLALQSDTVLFSKSHTCSAAQNDEISHDGRDVSCRAVSAVSRARQHVLRSCPHSPANTSCRAEQQGGFPPGGLFQGCFETRQPLHPGAGHTLKNKKEEECNRTSKTAWCWWWWWWWNCDTHLHAGGQSDGLQLSTTKKSGNMFRVGSFLDFVRLTTRTPHGAYVRGANRNRIDRHWVEIERLTTRTRPPSCRPQTRCGLSRLANHRRPTTGSSYRTLASYLPRPPWWDPRHAHQATV